MMPRTQDGPEAGTANSELEGDTAVTCPFALMMKVLDERDGQPDIIMPTEPDTQTVHHNMVARSRADDTGLPGLPIVHDDGFCLDDNSSLLTALPSPRADDVSEWDRELDLPELHMTHRGSNLRNTAIIEGAPVPQALLNRGLDDVGTGCGPISSATQQAIPGSPPLASRKPQVPKKVGAARDGLTSDSLQAFEQLQRTTATTPAKGPYSNRSGLRCPFSGSEVVVDGHGDSSASCSLRKTGSDTSLRKTSSETTSKSRESSGSARRSRAFTKGTAITGGSHTKDSGSGGRGRSKRHRRVATQVVYSAWEAATYAPTIRTTWQQALEQRPLIEIGGVFYDQLFVDIPEIQHMFSSGREVQASKFAEMLHAIVASVDSETNLYSTLRALAPMHVEKGVTVEHMPRMGAVLLSVLETILGGDFDRGARAAWEWLWAWLSKVMQQTLDEVRFGSNVITRSWNLAQDNCPDNQVGEVFFDTLFHFAPNLKAVYYKPKQILSGKFVEMLSTLVSYSGDKHRMEEQITWLGIRHVSYNAKAQHIQMLGDVLVKTMERCVGDGWTEEMCSEWRVLWDGACESLFGVMHDAERYGTTLSSIWKITEHKTTEGHFGATLKKNLLSGTEWVATLNRRIKEADGTTVTANPWTRLTTLRTSSGGDEASCSEGGGHKPPSSSPPGTLRTRQVNGDATATGSSSRSQSVASVAQDVGKQSGGRTFGFRRNSASHGSRTASSVGADSPQRSTLEESRPSYFNVMKAPSATSFAKRHLPGFVKEASEETLVQDKTSDCDAIGREFWDFLRQSITLLWQPERQNEEIIVRAHSMFRWGIRSSQLETIGQALEKTVAQIVQEAGAAWGQHERDAWAWFWSIAHRSLQRTLDVCERDDASVVAKSWALAQTLKAPEELGDSFFQNLARIAPYIVPLFRRPKRIQSAQFIDAVDLLVQFALNPKQFFLGFRGLVLRHIKYGVKAEYSKPFGQAILLGVKNALGEHWTEEVADAWNDLWLRVSSCISRSLNVGTNVLVVALVQGDVEKLEQAARCAPRQERHHWMTRVDVNGEQHSPLQWAMRDGKFNLVEFMLHDLLSIRADRDSYYYGREVLFTAHPDIVDMITRECPFLIDSLLDGLLWHSQFVDLDGKVRVNYYVEDMYGDPSKYPDAWTSSLAVLVRHGEPTNFVHPVVAKVLQLKWTSFCRTIFLLMQAWYLVLLALLMVGNIFHVGNCQHQPVRIVLAVTSAITAAVQTGFMMVQVAKGQTTPVSMWFRLRFALPVWLCSSWNIQRYISCVLLPFAALLEPCHLRRYSDAEHDSPVYAVPLSECDSITLAGRAFSAFTALLLWTQAMQIFVVSTRLAALSWSLGVMFQDVSRNLVVVAIFILAWTSALTALQEVHFEEFEGGLVSLCRHVLSLSPPENDDMHPLSAFFLFSFVIATNIGMMAILIAQIRSSYELVARHKVGFAMQHRAHICVDIESFLPIQYRQKLFNQFCFDEPVPFDQGDLGPPGGIQVRAPAAVRKHAKYIPDRVMRYTGVSCPTDPWDEEEDDDDAPQSEEDD